MSLINDALKKAQQAQAKGNSSLPKLSVPGSGSVGMPANQISITKIFVILIILASVFGGVVALVVFAILGLSQSDEPSIQPADQVIVSDSEPVTPPPVTDIEKSAANNQTPNQEDTAAFGAEITPPAQTAEPEQKQESIPEVAAEEEETPKKKPTIFGTVREVVNKGNANAALTDDVMEDEPDPLEEADQPQPSQTVETVSDTPPAENGEVVKNPAETVAKSDAPANTEVPAKIEPETADNISKPTTQKNKSGQDPQILAYLDMLQIQGIKLSGSRSKVLMNNKVYGLNSLVNRDFSLRIYKIKAQEIIFVDDAGVLYRKSI